MGWSGQFKDKESGEEILLDFDLVADLVDTKIQVINEEIDADQPPIIFLSNSEDLNNRLNKERKFRGEEEKEFVPMFRYDLAKSKPYKGNRKNPKPFHFDNLIAYFRSKYKTIIPEGGLEADDELSIYQTDALRRGVDTTICSRDKDLRICPGNHYSWECGGQASIGPVKTDRLGWLEIREGEVREDGTKSPDKYLGYGLSFFYFQLLTGDMVDNVPGLPGCGNVGAYKLLQDATSEEDLFSRVKQAYIDKLGKEKAKDYFLEQANLLWIRQERDKGYEFPVK